jgi:hypothetical protein
VSAIIKSYKPSRDQLVNGYYEVYSPPKVRVPHPDEGFVSSPSALPPSEARLLDDEFTYESCEDEVEEEVTASFLGSDPVD